MPDDQVLDEQPKDLPIEEQNTNEPKVFLYTMHKFYLSILTSTKDSFNF